MLLKQLQQASAGLLLGCAALSANASLIYGNFNHNGSEEVDYRVEIKHDKVDGEFDITYQVTNSASVQKFTGMFMDVSTQYNAGNLGLSNEFNPSNQLSCGQGFQVSRFSSQGCNSNLNQGGFDIGLVWDGVDLTAGNGIGGFSISDLGFLTLNDWGSIGMRAQAVNGDGSAKEVQYIADTAIAAPEPESLALLAIGLMGFATRRRALARQ